MYRPSQDSTRNTAALRRTPGHIDIDTNIDIDIDTDIDRDIDRDTISHSHTDIDMHTDIHGEIQSHRPTASTAQTQTRRHMCHISSVAHFGMRIEDRQTRGGVTRP